MFYNKKNKTGDLRFLETIVTKKDKIVDRKKILQRYTYWGYGYGEWYNVHCDQVVVEDIESRN